MAAKKMVRRHRQEKEEAGQRIIGIIGAGRSTGVTHLAILLAGYVSGVLRRSCAVIEWNCHGDFEKLGRICFKREKERKNPFQVLGVDYYGGAGTTELLLCKNREYQDVIVDYGSIEEGDFEEFLRCDRRFVVLSFSEWQISAFLEFAEQEKRADQKFQYFASFGSEEAEKNIEKRLKASVMRIPVSVDAWMVTSEIMKFFESIL